jgi:hypothetical protein
MNNTTKERQELIAGARTSFNFTRDEGSITSEIDPKLIEAYVAGAMASVHLANSKSTSYQVTIFADRDVAGVFQILTVPLVGDEITIHNRNGREQVYRVTKVRHAAYFSTAKMESSSNSNAIIWCEIIQNPVKVGLIF